jgi:cyclopropane fatty-acyl-phospholipid synthase-like methyltransferase
MTKKLGFESQLAIFADMNFADASFDGVWAYTSLIHVPKEEAGKIIARIHGYLKPSGAFVIGVIKGETDGMVERKTMPGTARYFKNYTSQELKDLIEPLGFKFIREQEYQPHNSIYLHQLYKARNPIEDL